MPGAADWQNLPNSVTDSITNTDLADSWAQDQQTRIASDWASAQRMVPPPQQPPPPAPTDASAPAGPPEAVYNVQSGDTLSGIAQRLGVPMGQLVSANKISNPNLISAGQTLNIGTGTAAPVGPGAATAGAKPVASANGNVPDWLVSTIQANAPDNLKDDPEFLKIVAAGAKAESNWDPHAVQQGGGGRGLFQFDVKGGMGAGASQDQINDPNWQAAKIMPRYASAYMDGQKQGLTGAELASYVAAQAEHPLGYDNPQSAARQNYRDAYNNIVYTPGQAGAANPPPSPSANQLDLGNIQSNPTATGSPTGLPSPTGPQPVGQGITPVENQRQFETEAGLTDAEAYTACGPVAAVAFAQTYGRNPTAQEAIQLAKDVGWNPSSGMAGVSSEQALLSKMGVQTKLETQVNWSNVQSDVNNGNPVILSTPNHYFYISDYDPASQTYGVGQSGLVFKGGASRMTAAQIQKLGGGVSGALYVDHPQAEGPSVAETTQPPDASQGVGGAIAQKLSNVKDAVGNAVGPGSPVANAVGNAINGPSAASQPTPLQNLGQNILSGPQVPGAPGLSTVVGSVLSAKPLDQQTPEQLVLASLGSGGAGSDEVAQLADQYSKYSPQIQSALQKTADSLAANGVSIDEIGTRLRTWMGANPPDTVNSITSGKAGVDTTPAASQPPSPQAAAAQSSTPAVPAETATAPQPVSAPPGAPPATPPTDTAAPPPPPPEGPPPVTFDQNGNQATPPPAASQAPTVGQIVSAAPSEAKKAIFSLTNVHASNIARGLLTSPAGPEGAAQFTARYVKAIVGGPQDIVNDPAFADQVQQAVSDGVNFFGGQNPDTGGAAPGTNPILTVAGRAVGGAVAGGATGAAYSAQSKDNQMLRDVLVGGAIGAVAGPTVAARMHDALWQDAVPAAKLMTYQAAVDGGADGAQAAMFANNLNGGQNLSAIAGSKPMTELMRWTLQSPDWLISQAKLAGAGVQGIAKTLIPGQTPTGNEQLSRDWLVKTVLTYGFVTEAFQYALTGHFTDQNSPGNRFQIEVPSGKPAANGKQQNVTVSIFPGNLQQILDAADRAQGLGPQGLGTTAWDKTNPITRTAIEDWGNFQYPGGPPIAPKNATPGQAAADKAGFTGQQFASIGATVPQEETNAGMNPDIVAILESLGIPMSHNTRPVQQPIKKGG